MLDASHKQLKFSSLAPAALRCPPEVPFAEYASQKYMIASVWRTVYNTKQVFKKFLERSANNAKKMDTNISVTVAAESRIKGCKSCVTSEFWLQVPKVAFTTPSAPMCVSVDLDKVENIFSIFVNSCKVSSEKDINIQYFLIFVNNQQKLAKIFILFTILVNTCQLSRQSCKICKQLQDSKLSRINIHILIQELNSYLHTSPPLTLPRNHHPG